MLIKKYDYCTMCFVLTVLYASLDMQNYCIFSSVKSAYAYTFNKYVQYNDTIHTCSEQQKGLHRALSPNAA